MTCDCWIAELQCGGNLRASGGKNSAHFRVRDRQKRLHNGRIELVPLPRSRRRIASSNGSPLRYGREDSMPLCLIVRPSPSKTVPVSRRMTTM